MMSDMTPEFERVINISSKRRLIHFMKTRKLANKMFPSFSGLICAVTCSLFCLLETTSVLSDDLSLKSLATSRVLVLGDSITYGGQYVADLETYLRLTFPDQPVNILNQGLPSETVSGLSEPGHAGGKFPRPDLHERLDRALAKLKPEIVLACYGMNCGIYHPHSVDHFEAYKVGMRRLHDRVVAAGAEIIHVTPPVFDPKPIAQRTLPAGLDVYGQPYEGYDEVLGLYAAWLLAMRGEGWKVVDIHSPMKQLLLDRRAKDPGFRFAGDGVHMNAEAHWLTAQWILGFFGASDHFGKWPTPDAMAASHLGKKSDLPKLIKQRQRLLCDSWLTDIGHLRPGMSKGLPINEATEKANELDAQVRDLITDRE